MKNNTCPDYEQILLFVDGELDDLEVANHIAECPHCLNIYQDIKRENELFKTLLSGINPLPDLSAKVMKKIEVHNHAHSLINAFSFLMVTATCAAYIFLSSAYTSFTEAQATYSILHYAVKTLGLLPSVFQTVYSYSLQAISGGTVLPPVMLLIIISIIAIYQKRRITNV